MHSSAQHLLVTVDIFTPILFFLYDQMNIQHNWLVTVDIFTPVLLFHYDQTNTQHNAETQRPEAEGG